jgi:hypothetical protein
MSNEKKKICIFLKCQPNFHNFYKLVIKSKKYMSLTIYYFLYTWCCVLDNWPYAHKQNTHF